MKKHVLASLSLTLAVPFLSLNAQTSSGYRTVMDTEMGGVFEHPSNGYTYADYGAYDGAQSYSNTVLSPEAVKIFYGRFIGFRPDDDASGGIGFPYNALRQYEASEVAAGRPPIFVTATYEGTSRPVLFVTSLSLNSAGQPTAPSSNWLYAVNVGDERFIKFWINNYFRPTVSQPLDKLTNLWLQADNSTWNLPAWGVLDDNNHFVGGVTWDSPFPQTAQAYLQGIETFFQTVKELAPDINIMPNVGSISIPSEYQSVYANVRGILWEDIYGWHLNPNAYVDQWYQQAMTWWSWFGATDRIGLVGANLADDTTPTLLNAFITYEMLKGPNFFFAPRLNNTDPLTQAPASTWLAWDAKLGTPVGVFQSTQQPGASIGHRLFTRQYSMGYVYLNWTGVTQTIALPAGNWYDPNGNLVKAISLPTWDGTFVSNGPSKTSVAMPAISPRTAHSLTGPVTVSIESPTAGATIRYTTNGSAPTASSPVYSGPFQLNTSSVVQARAFLSGDNASGTSAASYTIVAGAPTVEFATTSDSGPAGTSTCYPLLAVSAVPDTTISVDYTVKAPNGSTNSGTATFLPGEVYKEFPVALSGAGNWTVTLTSATGAVRGSTTTFTYTVQ